MPLVEWKDEKYSVGVEEMDEQHRNMVEIINKMHSAMKEGKGNEKIEEILEEMEDYTEYHFEAEEKLMENNDYSERKLKKQKEQHEKFVEKIEEYREKIEGGTLTLSMDIMNFLKDWLSNHIAEVDMKYKEFFEDKDV